MFQIEPHFYAILKSAEVACELTDLLPENDLVVELAHLLDTQADLMIHIVERKHYGTDSLRDFVDYTDELRTQVRRLKGDW